MTPEHLEELANAVEGLEIVWPDQLEAMNAARAELSAMRQPITAEALLADGWDERWKWFLLDGRFRMCWSDDDNRWEFEIGRVSDSGAFMHGVIIASPSNMHDLRELVRLLGGAK